MQRQYMQWYRSGHNEHDWKSCWRQKRHEGSNPSHCARQKACNLSGYRLFLVSKSSGLPLSLPQTDFYTPFLPQNERPGRAYPPGLCLCFSKVVIIALYPAGCVLLHALRGVRVHIQCKAGCGVSHEVLHRFDV